MYSNLGSIRLVVGDRKNLDVNTDKLSADVIAYNNYYPFGMPQPGRNFDSQEYRYGFQTCTDRSLRRKEKCVKN